MSKPSLSLIGYIYKMAHAYWDDTSSDAELLSRYAKLQDEKAFSALMVRHGAMVWSICRRILGNTQDVEDAYQTTFLVLAYKASKLHGETLVGWLHKVAHQTALTARRKAKTRQKLQQEELKSFLAHPQTAPENKQEDVYERLHGEIVKLPDKLRVALVLHYLESKTQAEVAHFLGVTESAVRDRLVRGKNLLQKRLSQRGLTLGAAGLGVLLETMTSPAALLPGLVQQKTARAAAAFRSGTLTGDAAEAARAVLETLPSSTIGTTIMRKSLWIVLACCLGLGGGATLVTYRSLSAQPDEPGEAGAAAAQALDQLGADGRAAVRLDCLGDPLPKGALARLGTTRLRHSGVLSVAFSPDGKTVASGGNNYMVRLWEATTGKEIRTLGGSQAGGAVAFSPDGKTMASGGWSGVMCLWGVATGKEIRTLHQNGVNGLTPVVTSVAFSPDGKTVAAGGRDSTVRLWEVATGKEIHTLQGPKGPKGEVYPVNSVTFSPDGKSLTSGGADGMVRLWEAATGKEIRTLHGHEGEVAAVAFAPDGKTVVTGGHDGAVRLWEAATSKEIRRLKWGGGMVWSVAFSPDGKTVATGGRRVRLWEVATGKEIRTLKGHQGCAVSVAFSPDGKTVAMGGHQDGMVRLWETATGKPIGMSMGHEGSVFSVAFASDSKTVITGGYDGTVRLWEAATGRRIRTLQGRQEQGRQERGIRSMAFAPDGRTVATRRENDGEERPLGEIVLWETATGKEIRSLWGSQKGRITSEVFAPDGKTLATGHAGGTVRLWETTTGKEIRILQGRRGDDILSIAFAPDGKTLATGYADGTVRLWETATGEEIRILQGRGRNGILSIAFAPDGKTLATGYAGGIVCLWETATGKEIHTLRENKWKGRVLAVVFSHDGRTLAAASSDCVQLWDLPSDDAFPPLVGHRGNVLGVAFSPDGRFLASVSEDTTGLVWELTHRATRPGTEMGPDALRALWDDLASQDAARAWRAVWSLAAAPAQSVPLLRDRLRPVPADAGKRLPRLIADLDADEFKVREGAYRELEKLGPDVELALRKGLGGRPSVEMRKRLQQLLAAVVEQNKRGFSGEVLRGLRAVAVLEQIGTPQAREILKALAAGGAGFPLTQEAQDALCRLEGARRP